MISKALYALQGFFIADLPQGSFPQIPTFAAIKIDVQWQLKSKWPTRW
jgi:hypothetical protein